MKERKELLEKQTSYWKEELAGAPTRLELPTDKPRPAVQTFRGARESFGLPKELLERLKSIGRGEEANLFMTLGAGFMILLHRYTGQDDILVGAPIFGRSRREARSLVGQMVNCVVLRSRFTDDLDFRSLLQQARGRVLGAYAHSDLPFEQLVTALVPEQDPSHAPLFQTMFVLNSADGGSLKLEVTENGLLKTQTSKLDLTLFVAESANGSEGLIEYNADLFEVDTIQRLCGHYLTLLEAISRDPDRSISTLPMLTARERTQILYEWNDTRTDFPKACVHELFEQQVALHPDAIAMVFAGRQLSYREVNQRANQMAHRLRKCGVGPEVLVGVCLERGVEMLIALLGVWKAGGAYVPLDPSYPKERLSYMLRDAAVKVLLTESKLRHSLQTIEDNTICVDFDWPLIEQESTGNLHSAVTASNLAYVMYTSGSTGEPKGVMVLHRGLVNYLCWAVKAYSAGQGGAVPVHTSIAFDLTVTGLYAPLLAGGCVEMLAEDVGGQSLVTALREGEERSLVKITPAHLALLSQQMGPESAAGRTKLFVIGGENLLAESLLLWRDFAPATRLINEYGPTETVVGCCVYEVRAADPRSGSVPIGRPIANTQLYVLDRYRNPVPAGVVGELYIGGAGVARGYLNRQELTQERFIADPFSGDSGARLYKTGDLARYRKDGTLEYLGRVDNQVKVRGYRIELGEIEATLADHSGVKSCAVLAWEDESGNKQLIGYVIARNDELPTTEDLRHFLRQKLPEYMIPAQFVFLDSIPLTANGKIDRKALPAPSHDNDSVAREFVPARTEAEKALAAIWAAMLKLENVGLNDDFFDLGGHSLLAIKAVSRIRDVFEVDLQIQTLFENPTIAGLAKILTEAKGTSRSDPRAEQHKLGIFLGPRKQRVFAMYHRPRGGSSQVLTVICPPLFNEYMRTHFALRELAVSLAERGQHVLRLDYRGTGDSFGELEEVTISDWVEDIALAVREGRDLSGSSAVRVLGVRAGALLACRSVGASRDVQRLVLWDPVPDGAGYLQTLRRIQVAILEQDVSLSDAERRETLHEYAGHGLSERMLDEFRLLDASAYSSVPKRKLHVVSTTSDTAFPVPGVSQGVAQFACNWETNLDELMIPNPVLERLSACLTMS